MPFEAGAFELVFLAMVALVVVGPKDLPILLRKVGQFTAKMRGLASEFRASFDEMARQSELDELRKEVEALRTGQFAQAALPGVEDHLRDIDASLRDRPAPVIEGPVPERQGTPPLPVLNARAAIDEPRFTDDLDAEPMLPFDGPAGDEAWREEPRPPPVVRAADGPRPTDDVDTHPAHAFDGPAGEEDFRAETPRAVAPAESSPAAKDAPARPASRARRGPLHQPSAGPPPPLRGGRSG